ncbi:hypothetical protein [Parabacteroides sp. Marseille-P3160]|uniref:hypothetical protein n=1 Tax=Parabacteroides sp. Marseille-P3160 TaxID=1917887 RepID=UPI001F2A7374|nr:hypothetical protein [Parabacteroides sp. Marseille-P3160]
MKSTYRILFLLRKNRQDKDGLSKVAVRITIGCEAVEFNTHLSVLVYLWNPVDRLNGKTKEAIKANDALFKIRSDINAANLTKDNIFEDVLGQKWIRLTRQKSSVQANFPLLDVPLSILKKYSGLENSKLLPIHTNQKDERTFERDCYFMRNQQAFDNTLRKAQLLNPYPDQRYFH